MLYAVSLTPVRYKIRVITECDDYTPIATLSKEIRQYSFIRISNKGGGTLRLLYYTPKF